MNVGRAASAFFAYDHSAHCLPSNQNQNASSTGEQP